MTVARKLAILVAASAFAVGCGSNNDCTLTPPLSHAPSSCSAKPGTTLDVSVNWCTCNSDVVCEVQDVGGGVIQLEPKVQSCDASCPATSADCPAAAIHCSVPVPSASATYNLYVFGATNADGFQNVNLQVSGGGSNSCSG